MTPQKQLFRHEPSEGVIGDCWRTCFACLLDIQPHEVPHFCDGDLWDNGPAATANAKEFLATHGLSCIDYAVSGELGDVLRSIGACNPGLHYMLSGKSRTGCNHLVICCDDAIVWDPSLDDAGIVGPCEPDGYYWITWLVPSIISKRSL